MARTFGRIIFILRSSILIPTRYFATAKLGEQEVVIVGYTEPRKSRKYFGSLVLAVRDKTNKRRVYAGHVGIGFDKAALMSLYGTMQPLRTEKRPFDQK
jgi:bifunctional non-homologous end joining protein LigD